VGEISYLPPLEHNKQAPSQFRYLMSNVSSSSQNDMFKVTVVPQQIMKELSAAQSEVDRILVTTKIELKFVKHIGCM
jgi:hypothetical protein